MAPGPPWVSSRTTMCRSKTIRWCSMVGRLWGNVFVLAMTVRATGNRFTEVPETVHYSYWPAGPLFSSTSGNQATHCVYTEGASPYQQGNQVANTTFCPENG